MNAQTENKLLASVYTAGRIHGSASAKSIQVLRSRAIDWDDTDQVKIIADEFKLGHIAGYFELDKREDAMEIFDLHVDERDERQQRAHRAAISAWSHVRAQVGAPNARNGSDRAAREPANDNRNATTKVAVKEIAAVPAGALVDLTPIIERVLPKVARQPDVSEFASWLCDLIAAFETKNTGLKMGEYRSLFHSFVGDVRKLNRSIAAAEKSA